MSDNIKSIDYQLETPVPYAFEGNMIEGTFVTLYPPTSKNIVECAQLKQAFFRSLPKDQNTEDVTEDDKSKAEDALTGDAIIALLSMSTEVDLGKIMLTARELFSSGVGKMEGETKLTKPILDKVSFDDLEGMLGAYLVNFILASALRKMKEV